MPPDQAKPFAHPRLPAETHPCARQPEIATSTRNGIYHSENAVMTERISRDGDIITWLRVLEDPDHFTQPVASILQYRRAPYPEVLPYGTCTLQQQDAR